MLQFFNASSATPPVDLKCGIVHGEFAKSHVSKIGAHLLSSAKFAKENMLASDLFELLVFCIE